MCWFTFLRNHNSTIVCFPFTYITPTFNQVQSMWALVSSVIKKLLVNNEHTIFKTFHWTPSTIVNSTILTKKHNIPHQMAPTTNLVVVAPTTSVVSNIPINLNSLHLHPLLQLICKPNVQVIQEIQENGIYNFEFLLKVRNNESIWYSYVDVIYLGDDNAQTWSRFKRVKGKYSSYENPLKSKQGNPNNPIGEIVKYHHSSMQRKLKMKLVWKLLIFKTIWNHPSQNGNAF